MSKPYTERMQEYKDRIDSDYHDVFTELVGHGSNPKSIGAAIQYVTTPSTQSDAADDWDCSQVAVRENYPGVLALLDKEDTEPVPGKETAAEVLRDIVEELGWESGREYSVVEQYGSEYPKVNKPGLMSLRDTLVGDTDD